MGGEATNRTDSFESGAVAHVNFRVRCETLGHGEEVFLVAQGDEGHSKVRSFREIARVVLLSAVKVYHEMDFSSVRVEPFVSLGSEALSSSCVLSTRLC